MSFLQAAQQIVKNPAGHDPIMVETLNYLINNNHIGRNNSVPMNDVVAHLVNQRYQISREGFQQTILKDTRDDQGNDVFIASCNRGIYLINGAEDARMCAEFYRSRIRSEQSNLDNLIRLAGI